ncbi:MAG: hypothetical protein IJM90_00950 [Firmicutes bacterium]|nr:hypothetical protein [Bacillota bacterium]
MKILLLEDDPADAREFLNLIQQVRNELGDNTALNGLQMKDDIDDNTSLVQALADCDVCWVCTMDAFYQANHGEYPLWIIDLRLNEKGSINTWELFAQYQHAHNADPRPPIIWVLSHYSHLDAAVRQFLSVQRFYSKTEAGYHQLKNDLTDLLSPKSEQDDFRKIQFQTGTGSDQSFKVDYIIAIASMPKSGKESSSHRRAYMLYYQTNEDGNVIPYRLNENQSLPRVLNLLYDKGFHEFEMVSRDLIINTHQLISISAAENGGVITMAGYHNNEPIQVNRKVYSQLLEKLKLTTT